MCFERKRMQHNRLGKSIGENGLPVLHFAMYECDKNINENDDRVIGGFYNFHCHLSYNQTKPPNGCNVALGDCLCANWFDWFNVNILHDISPHVILYVFLPPLIFARQW